MKYSDEVGRTISVIIPVWRDSPALDQLVRRLKRLPWVRQVIVSAAEPAIDLPARVHSLGVIYVETAKPNRGRQLNLGAAVARGHWLLFHHADSELSEEHLSALAQLASSSVIGGAFYRRFDERHPALRWLEPFERWHSRAFGTLYGDQSIFVQRSHFMSLGGFARIPLMEDVEFSTRLRCSGGIALLDPPISSSPRDQIERGTWKVTLRNLLFLILFRCGISAHHLHAWYYHSTAEKKGHRAVSPERNPALDDVPVIP